MSYGQLRLSGASAPYAAAACRDEHFPPNHLPPQRRPELYGSELCSERQLHATPLRERERRESSALLAVTPHKTPFLSHFSVTRPASSVWVVIYVEIRPTHFSFFGFRRCWLIITPLRSKEARASAVPGSDRGCGGCAQGAWSCLWFGTL